MKIRWRRGGCNGHGNINQVEMVDADSDKAIISKCCVYGGDKQTFPCTEGPSSVSQQAGGESLYTPPLVAHSF